MTFPTEPVAVPAVAEAIAAGRPPRAAWFDAYGVTADTERITYYRRSWD